MPAEDRPLMQQIHRVLYAWNEVVKTISRNLGIPPCYNSILLYLAKHGRSSQKTIADCFQITPSAVCQTIRHMKEDGLLQQEQLELDGRVSSLRLTERGQLKATELKTQLNLADQKLTDSFTSENREQLLNLLTLLQHTIDSTLLHD